MVQEAAENAEADKKLRTLIETRNSAEAQVHEVKKDLEEYRDQLTEDEVKEIETVIAAVEEAAKGEEAEKITEELNKVFPAIKSLLEKKQANEQAKAQAEAASPDSDVVDAEFTETKE
jgi:molecular chaperone DnaK